MFYNSTDLYIIIVWLFPILPLIIISIYFILLTY